MAIEEGPLEIELPCIDPQHLKDVLEGQKGEISKSILKWKEKGTPGKVDTLNLGSEEISVLRHFSIFRVNKQGVIFRLFPCPNGITDILIFIEGAHLEKKIWEIHMKLGHGGAKPVFEILRQGLYATNFRMRIRDLLQTCEICLKFNIPKTKKEGMSTLLPSQSREVLQMDILGPLPQSNGFRYILAMVDGWSRFCYLRPLKTTSSEEMGKILAKFFTENGLWGAVKIDGKCLSLKGVDKQLVDILGVGIIRSNYCSRQQGNVERLFQSMLRKILKLLDKERDLQGWSSILQKIEFILNIAPHRNLGYMSPFQCVFRRPPALLLPALPERGREGSEFNLLSKMSDTIRMHAFRSLVGSKNFEYPGEGLTKGQLVWRKRKSFSRHMNAKLQTKIIEAFRVEERLGTGLYKLKSVITSNLIILPIEQLIPTRLTEIQVIEILTKINGGEGREEGSE